MEIYHEQARDPVVDPDRLCAHSAIRPEMSGTYSRWDKDWAGKAQERICTTSLHLFRMLVGVMREGEKCTRYMVTPSCDNKSTV